MEEPFLETISCRLVRDWIRSGATRTTADVLFIDAARNMVQHERTVRAGPQNPSADPIPQKLGTELFKRIDCQLSSASGIRYRIR